ncbi:TLP18.3, Psb32 and MOLO-1 founding protein of phosphatase [Methylophilus rhizosphaerae]|uniref:TLP18.3, Psb32 and MOLO-1 founding protein of phosphatase n=1 Tax=Methylophilus rhizosphaerae TaxID=492660 RepID=A0A1G9D587_9PROT|nr:TPM domain-containing protein [Methylophilus rhizosphaerae]SDK59116.1 TLP18.3, Psb32 and MOLO-1 founding protein of phosphatase [Methylophilus rhizosphaerae]
MKPIHPAKRFLRHITSHPWQVRRYFSETALQHIEQAIADSERRHAGEVRVVIESGLPLSAIMQRLSPRQRAIQLFGQLNIWDTEHNNGVLIYLMLADRDVEIVADRGIHRHVGDRGWQHICRQMEEMFRSGQFEQGVTHGITAIGQHLADYFPPEAIPRNELSNHVLVL